MSQEKSTQRSAALLRRTLDRLQRNGALAGSRTLNVEVQLTLLGINIDHHVIAMQDFAVQNLHGQRILHQSLDRSLQRSSAVRSVLSFLEDQLLCRWSELNRDSAIRQHLAQISQPQIDNAHELCLI